MITEEEFNNIEIGDKIKIVDKWNKRTRENPNGDMDYLLGQTIPVSFSAIEVAVEKVSGRIGFKIRQRDGDRDDYWYLNSHCIKKVIKCNHYEKEIMRLNQKIKKLENDNEELKQKILKIATRW